MKNTYFILRKIVNNYLHKTTFFNFIKLISSWILTITAQKYCLQQNNIPLPDIIHKYFSNEWLCVNYKYSDIYMNILLIITLIFYNKNIHKFINILSILYTIRSISFSLTVLPKCSYSKPIDINKSSINILIDFVTGRQSMRMNNDLLPSGHTLVMWSCVKHILYNYPKFNNLYLFNIKYKTILNLLTILNSVYIIVCKCHYSIDVLWGYILTDYIYLLNYNSK